MGWKQQQIQKVLDVIGAAHKNPLSALSDLESREAAEFIQENMTHETSVFSNEAKFREAYFSIEVLKAKSGLLIDFGVLRGRSTLQIASALQTLGSRKVHAFDAFLGLRDPWSKVDRSLGSMNLQGLPPRELLSHKNIETHVGWVEDTLPSFLASHDGPVGMAHFDFDVFPPTNFALASIEDRLGAGSLIIFDDFFGFIGWRHHSYKAFIEVLEVEDWRLEAVSPKQAAFSKKPST